MCMWCRVVGFNLYTLCFMGFYELLITCRFCEVRADVCAVNMVEYSRNNKTKIPPPRTIKTSLDSIMIPNVEKWISKINLRICGEKKSEMFVNLQFVSVVVTTIHCMFVNFPKKQGWDIYKCFKFCWKTLRKDFA